jgi:hypothetical protein
LAPVRTAVTGAREQRGIEDILQARLQSDWPPIVDARTNSCHDRDERERKHQRQRTLRFSAEAQKWLLITRQMLLSITRNIHAVVSNGFLIYCMQMPEIAANSRRNCRKFDDNAVGMDMHERPQPEARACEHRDAGVVGLFNILR